MTAPLYEVKNKFSQYVARAQKGEIIEVQKHGKPAVVIIDAENYYANPQQTQKSNGFAEWYKEWRKEWEEILAEEGDDGMDEYWEILEKSRKRYSKPRKNAFIEVLGIKQK